MSLIICKKINSSDRQKYLLLEFKSGKLNVSRRIASGTSRKASNRFCLRHKGAEQAKLIYQSIQISFPQIAWMGDAFIITVLIRSVQSLLSNIVDLILTGSNWWLAWLWTLLPSLKYCTPFANKENEFTTNLAIPLDLFPCAQPPMSLSNRQLKSLNICCIILRVVGIFSAGGITEIGFHPHPWNKITHQVLWYMNHPSTEYHFHQRSNKVMQVDNG